MVFVVLNGLLGLNHAILGSLILAGFFSALRLFKRQPVRFALGGLSGVLIALLAVQLLGKAEGFFLPGMISGSLNILTALVSILVKRPFVAWTSHFARSWPWGWYWHPKVRPAYSEVT